MLRPRGDRQLGVAEALLPVHRKKDVPDVGEKFDNGAPPISHLAVSLREGRTAHLVELRLPGLAVRQRESIMLHAGGAICDTRAVSDARRHMRFIFGSGDDRYVSLNTRMGKYCEDYVLLMASTSKIEAALRLVSFLRVISSRAKTLAIPLFFVIPRAGDRISWILSRFWVCPEGIPVKQRTGVPSKQQSLEFMVREYQLGQAQRVVG